MKFAKLIEAAKKARANAYAPYSGFQVGAAVLGKDGLIFTGCNVENASYSLTICAERAAVFKAVCAGTTGFDAIAVVTELDVPAAPCGACRQILAEFSPEMEVIMANTRGESRTATLRELLPLAFDSSVLEGKHCD